MKSQALSGFAARSSGFAALASGALASALLGVLCAGGSVAAGSSSNVGPVRLARFSYVSNDVSWRPDSHASWSRAVRNLPLRQGAQISAANGARAEIQFDDGSRLWMARGTVVSLRSLYSDADGEFTEITVRGGTIGLAPRNARSVYQVDAPFVSVDAAGPCRFRIDAAYGMQVRERQGHVMIQGGRGRATLNAGDYVDLRSPNDPYDIGNMPAPDAFDDWTSNVTVHQARYRQSPKRRYVPNNVALVSDDLDDYGTWRSRPRYGEVWYPRERTSGWRPYHSGHWVWVSPFGWTWVASEPWGWAPYHYGSWIHDPDGWGWVPGPSRQYWSPATVDYSEQNGNVAWCPLAPSEVRYQPALSIGYRGGDWALVFSIGAAAVYYPTQQGYCEPRPWSSGYSNNTTYVNNVTNINNYYGGSMRNRNSYFGNQGYIPVNSRFAAGASQCQAGAFGGSGNYQSLPSGGNRAFAQGRRIGAPTGTYASFAGPPSARLTASALSPTRSFERVNPVSRALQSRAIYQGRGTPGNANAVREARSLGASAAFGGGPRAAAPSNTRRSAGSDQRYPSAIVPRESGARTGRPSNPAAPRLFGKVAVSPAQRATQARTALGRPSGASRAWPGSNPAGQRRTGSPSATTGRRSAPAQQRTARPSQGSPAQRTADHARNAIGLRPRTGAVTRPVNGPGNRAAAPRQAQPRAQRSAPRQNRQQAQPRAQRSAPQQNRQQAQPRVQQSAPQQNRQQAEPRAQRSAPRQNRQQAQPRAQRSAPQQNRQQAQPRAQRTAPQQNRQQAQPRAQRSAPQQNRQQAQPRAQRTAPQQNRQQAQPRAQRSAPQQNRQQAQPRAQRSAPRQNRQQAQPRAQRNTPQPQQRPGPPAPQHPQRVRAPGPPHAPGKAPGNPKDDNKRRP